MSAVFRLLLLCGAVPALAQLPASEAPSASDQPLVQAEITRLQNGLTNAPDKPAITYQIARTWAWAKQWPETIEWLNKAVEFRAGIDPSRDSIFAPLSGTLEFDAVLSKVREATPLAAHSRLAFTIAEGDLVPESIAYDPNSKSFYLGSMRKGKIIRCSAAGKCRDFSTGLGTVLGLKAAQGRLWALNNAADRSELIQFELGSGRVIARHAVTGSGHEFNDLTIAPHGDVYLTDTPAGLVWQLVPGARQLVQLPGRFNFANGITLSEDGSLLYVSIYPEGITVLDLRSGAAAPLARPSSWCLANIDGLYFDQGRSSDQAALVAIQNGIMNPRVIRIKLNPDLRSAVRLEVRERRNPLFDGITTGVIAGRDFIYMANIQDEKQSGFGPISILQTHF